MRVLQLIDSLRPGGAEKMSVSYANALAKRIDASFLCCTRKEGLLKEQLDPEVGYLFLNKKITLDLQAFWKLRKFVKVHEVDLIHSHGSSWFLALLVKISLSNVKLVWHDHWGERGWKDKPPGILKPASKFFDGVLAVNSDLKEWAESNLKLTKVIYLPNFVSESSYTEELPAEVGTVLNGDKNSFKIICLANLRAPKDHITLLRAFKEVLKTCPNTSLHLVGKDEKDDYSRNLKYFVKKNELQNKVFFYGEQGDVKPFLLSADMGVLSSKTEGLPLTLLEYGLFNLPVVCTRVGQCEEVIGNSGLIISPGKPKKFSAAIINYIKDPELYTEHSNAFHYRVSKKFSEKGVLKEIEAFYCRIVISE